MTIFYMTQTFFYIITFISHKKKNPLVKVIYTRQIREIINSSLGSQTHEHVQGLLKLKYINISL
jgi:hypothetical protein